MSVFSCLVAAAGDSFITVVLLSFFSAGGLVTVVSFCSQATNSATPASRQMYFFILTIRISVRSGRLSACYSISSVGHSRVCSNCPRQKTAAQLRWKSRERLESKRSGPVTNHSDRLVDLYLIIRTSANPSFQSPNGIGVSQKRPAGFKANFARKSADACIILPSRGN